MSSSPDSTEDVGLQPGQMAGEYRIEVKIGEGGMGTVYRAHHPVIGKRAAVKVLHSDLCGSQYAVDRFVLEAQSINKIGHPNIVDVFAFGRLDDGRFFFVMELLEGRSLRARLRSPIPLAEAIYILDVVAKTLQAAHDAGVIHRDLKPDNIFLSDFRDTGPAIKLLDFGLAKLTNPDAESRIGMERTRTGIIMGTPNYLSPEQAKGTKVDLTTDIYSLGALAYEMVTGRIPFTADNAVEVMAMHIGTEPVPPRELKRRLPRELDAIILRMLAKEPQHRPSLREVRDCFARLGARTPPPALEPPPPADFAAAPTTPDLSELAKTTIRHQRRRSIVLGVFVCIALAGAIVAVMASGREGKTDEPAIASVDPPRSSEPVKSEPEPGVEPAKSDSKGAKSDAEPAPETVKPEPESAKPEPEPAKPDAKLDPEPPKPAVTGKRPPPKVVAVTGRGMVRIKILGAPARGASLMVDGRVVNNAVVSTSLPMPVGKHTLRAFVGQRRVGVAVVDIEAGKTKDVAIRLKNLDDVPDPFGGGSP